MSELPTSPDSALSTQDSALSTDSSALSTQHSALNGHSALREEDEISLLDLLIVLAKHKKLILGLPFLAAVIAAGISLLMPNIYTARAVILPPQQSQSTAAALLGQLGGAAGLAGATLGIKNPADLYVGMIKSRTVADSLIQRFDLQNLYEAETADDTRKALANLSDIRAGRDGLITIEADDRDPKRAAALANAYVEELDRLTQTLAVTEAGQRRLYFEKQLGLTKDGLAEAEVALRRTQEQTGMIRLDEQGKALIEAIAALRAQIAAKEVQLSAMRSFATESNPDLIRTRRELAGLRSELVKLEKKDSNPAGDIIVPAGSVPEVGLEYVRKLRDVKYHETLFELLAKQYEIARADEARDASVVQVLDQAIAPERKSKPKRTQIVILTGLIVGFLAVILAFIREALDKARRDPTSAGRIDALRQYLRFR